MTTPTFRDIELLSAFLDDQITGKERFKLEKRLNSDRELSSALEELRESRAVLHRIPLRHAPRNFTLTPKMVGMKPPVPRSVPLLSWASGIAMLIFFATLGMNFIGQFSAGAPVSAPLSYGMGGGDGGQGNLMQTPTPQYRGLLAPQPTGGLQESLPTSTVKPPTPLSSTSYWSYLWIGIALILLISALIIRRQSVHAFQNRIKQKPPK